MTSAHTGTATDQLRQAYKNVLLQIYHDLNREHLRRLRRCCTGCISKQDAETVTIFRCLEHEGKISWENVKFLKELMGTMQRLDIVKKLTEFEVKRDLTILLDFYARKRNGSDLRCCSVSVKKLAGYLTRIADIVRDNVDLSSLNITVETSKDIRKALVDFEEEIDCRAELMFSWNEFTMLVVIAGELTAVSSESRQSEPFMELCSTAADELCSRMIELGSWEEFCDQVKEKYHLVYHRQNLDAKPSLTSQKQRAEVVQRLMEGIFFPQDHFKDAFLCTYC